MGDDHDRRTLWCGNLAPTVTDELLYELFLQAGPIENVYIPKDKDGKIRNYGFVTFKHELSVVYAMNIMEGTSLFGRNLIMKNRKVTEQQRQLDQQHHSRGHYRSYSMPSNLGQQSPHALMPPPMPQHSMNMLSQSLLTLQGLQAQQMFLPPMMMPSSYDAPDMMPPHNMRQGTQGYYHGSRQDRQDQEYHHESKEQADRSHSRSNDRRRSAKDRPHMNDKPYNRHRR